MTTLIPIEQAPKDKTELLLFTVQEDKSFSHIDIGFWGVIEEPNFENGLTSPVFGWLSNFGMIEEPTHYLLVPQLMEPKTSWQRLLDAGEEPCCDCIWKEGEVTIYCPSHTKLAVDVLRQDHFGTREETIDLYRLTVKKLQEAIERNIAILNRRVAVENFLLECASGKRSLPDAETCRELAYKLGVPEV